MGQEDRTPDDGSARIRVLTGGWLPFARATPAVKASPSVGTTREAASIVARMNKGAKDG